MQIFHIYVPAGKTNMIRHHLRARHQCVEYRIIIYTACIEWNHSVLHPINDAVLRLQTYNQSLSVISHPAAEEQLTLNMMVFLRRPRCSCPPMGITMTSILWRSIYHWFKGNSGISCILKESYIHNVSTCVLEKRERIYNSTQAFWWLLPQGLWPFCFFFSDPFSALSWSSWHKVCNRLSENTLFSCNLLYVCAFCSS